MDDQTYVETSLAIFTQLIIGYKKRNMLDYAASAEYVRDQIAAHHVKSLYDKADSQNTPNQLAV